MDSLDRPLPACTPPDPERVFARGLVLAQLGFRASVDLQASHPDARAHYEDLQAWLGTRQFSSEMEASEQGCLAAPLGELTPMELVECSSEFEAAGVMAWALGFLEVPPHDQLVRGADVLEAMGMTHPEGMETRLARLELRSRDEIHTLSRKVHLIHWRLRRFQLAPEEPADSPELVQWRSEAEELGIELLQGDLPVDRVPLPDALRDRVQQCLGAIEPRHRALNWLQGYYVLYSEIPRPSRSSPFSRLAS